MQALAGFVSGDGSGGPARNALAEGLVIFAWVALWRPVDVLIYEWIPLRQQRRILERLVAAPVEVRTGSAAGNDAAGERTAVDPL